MNLEDLIEAFRKRLNANEVVFSDGYVDCPIDDVIISLKEAWKELEK